MYTPGPQTVPVPQAPVMQEIPQPQENLKHLLSPKVMMSVGLSSS